MERTGKGHPESSGPLEGDDLLFVSLQQVEEHGQAKVASWCA